MKGNKVRVLQVNISFKVKSLLTKCSDYLEYFFALGLTNNCLDSQWRVLFHFLQTAWQCQPLLLFLKLSVLLPPLHPRHCQNDNNFQIDHQMQGTLSTADMMLCLRLLSSVCLWQDLKPVDVTNKRSLWENKGASPTKVAMIHFTMRNVFADQSTSLNQRGGNPSQPPDEVLTTPNCFVVLKGFPVFFHSFPDVNHKIVLFKRWCRDIQIISRFWPWCHGSNNHLCLFLF